MLTAAGLALVLAAPAPHPADNPDLRCVAAISFALGSLAATPADGTRGGQSGGQSGGQFGDKPEEKAVDAASLTALFMYFLGKVDARHPGFDYGAAMKRLFAQPGYSGQLPADLARCGREAQERGVMLQDLGRELQGITPLVPSQPG